MWVVRCPWCKATGNIYLQKKEAPLVHPRAQAQWVRPLTDDSFLCLDCDSSWSSHGVEVVVAVIEVGPEVRAIPPVQRKPVGECLRASRRRRGWTQSELASFLGVASAAQVSHWETGFRTPAASSLSLLADVLGVSTDALLGRIDGA